MAIQECVYRSDKPNRPPSHPWMSWHNHTGAFPRFSYCPTAGLSLARYQAALAREPDVWAGFAITDHAFSIAIPDPGSSWPYNWYEDGTVLDTHLASGVSARRLEAYLAFCASFRDGRRFYQGIEIESDVRGRMAIPPEVLPRFDVVIASIHTNPGPPERWEERHFFQIEKALRLPCDIIGHPLRHLRAHAQPGRSLPQAIIDGTLDRIAAADVAVEINAHYPQIHDDVLMLRGAFARGLRVAFSMDLHFPEEFGNWRYFEDVVERAGVDYGTLNLFTPEPSRRGGGTTRRQEGMS